MMIANFFTGALLCNALPHLAAGLQGRRFQTPFARPRGVGESSALVNVLWGFFNLLAGLALLYLSLSGIVMYVKLWRRRAGNGRKALVW